MKYTSCSISSDGISVWQKVDDLTLTIGYTQESDAGGDNKAFSNTPQIPRISIFVGTSFPKYNMEVLCLHSQTPLIARYRARAHYPPSTGTSQEQCLGIGSGYSLASVPHPQIQCPHEVRHSCFGDRLLQPHYQVRCTESE